MRSRYFVGIFFNVDHCEQGRLDHRNWMACIFGLELELEACSGRALSRNRSNSDNHHIAWHGRYTTTSRASLLESRASINRA